MVVREVLDVWTKVRIWTDLGVRVAVVLMVWVLFVVCLSVVRLVWSGEVGVLAVGLGLMFNVVRRL